MVKAIGTVRQRYQTVREVADLLRVGEPTVRRWIRDGELRAIDIGKGWRISAADLDAFLKGHETRPAGDAGGGASARSGPATGAGAEAGAGAGDGQDA